MNISVKIVGMDKLQARLNRAGQKMPGEIKTAMVASTDLVKSRARAKAPHVTGNLQRSIFTEVKPWLGIIGVGASYGAGVEFGTKPHTITPTNKKALAFVSHGFGWIVKSVNHPGTRPKPFLTPAFENSLSSIKEIFKRAITKVLS